MAHPSPDIEASDPGGNPFTYPFPGGINFFSNHDGTATLEGTPRVPGTYHAVLTTLDQQVGGPSTSELFTLIVVNQIPAFTSATTTTALIGQPMSVTVTTTGSPTAASAETGTLPPGVNFVDNGDGTATSPAPRGGHRGTYP